MNVTGSVDLMPLSVNNDQISDATLVFSPEKIKISEPSPAVRQELDTGGARDSNCASSTDYKSQTLKWLLNQFEKRFICVVLVINLEHDLVAQTRLTFISDFANLKRENVELRNKLLHVAAEKKKLNETISMSLGDRTMASCVQTSEEYIQLQKESVSLSFV